MEIPENYRLFKFKNGEDVIAETFKSPDDDKHFILRRPMQIQIMLGPDRNGNPIPTKLIMTEWLAFSQNDVAVVPRDNILCEGTPTKMIVKVYDSEKKRIDKMRENMDMDAAPTNELEKTDEQIALEKKAAQRKIQKKMKMVFMQMSLATLLKLLESLGLDIEEEPWKSVIDAAESEDGDEDEEDFESEPENLDGRLDIMPDVDGDGHVDPYGNRYPDPDSDPSDN